MTIATGMIPYLSSEYNSTIQALKDHLDSGHGITSISMHSPVYMTEGAYWRGPVWINLNYMVLRGLKLYYPKESLY